MDLQFRGKKAFVMAASKGLGRGVATILAAEGAEVILASSNEANIQKTAKEIGGSCGRSVSYYVIDARSRESVKGADTILREHGSIDILVTNNPGPEVTDAATVDETLLDKALTTNFVSAVLLCQKFIPGMIAKKFGRIIHLTSTTAKEPDTGMVLSNVTRAAVLAYSKTLSREIAQHGITVNTILTGGVMTDRTIELRKIRSEKTGIPYDQLLKDASKNFPVGFIATPEQFSAAVAFLASPVSCFINGISLPVDGGIMRGM